MNDATPRMDFWEHQRRTCSNETTGMERKKQLYKHNTFPKQSEKRPEEEIYPGASEMVSALGKSTLLPKL